MKYLKWVSWGTLMLGAVLCMALGFLAGWALSPEKEMLREEQSAQAKEQNTVGEEAAQSGQAAAPQTLPPEQPVQKVAAPEYILRRSGEGLVILQADEVLTAVSLPWDSLPAEERALLEAGIPFETLADIESFLEGYDS